MAHTRPGRLLRFAPIILALWWVMGDAKPAMAETTCFQDLRSCYGRAAAKLDWVDMWLAGLDCELGFTDCFRRALIGR